MLLGLFWMIVANAATLLGAHALLRRLRTGAPDLDLLLFLLLRTLLISAAVLAALLVGVLRGPLLGLAGAAALAALVAAGEHRRLPALRLPALPPLAWALGAFLLLRLLAQIWFLAPAGIDVLSYHLPKTAEWVRLGTLAAAPGVDFREPFAAGFELLEVWWTVFLRHDVLIETAGAEMMATGFAAMVVLGRSVGLTERGALLGGLLYVLTPGVYLLSVSAANDPPTAALFLATAALLVRRAPPLLLCIPAGLGIGIKATFAIGAPGLLLLAWLVRRDAPSPPPPRRVALPVALAALACGTFWHLRTTILFGSPAGPLADAPLVHAVTPVTGTLAWLPMRIRFLLDQALPDRGILSSVLPNVCGWGPLAFCALPALVPALQEHPPLRRLGAAFGLSLASLLLLATPPLHFQRFLLFFPALPILAFLRLAADRPGLRAFLPLPLALLLLATFLPHDVDVPKLRFLAAQPWRERATRPDLRALPPDGPIAYAFGMNSMCYEALAPDFRRPIFAVKEAASPEDLRDRLRRGGARWFCSRGTAASSDLARAVAGAERAGYLRRVAPDLFECVPP